MLYKLIICFFLIGISVLQAEDYETLTVRVRSIDGLQKCYISSCVSTLDNLSKEYTDKLFDIFQNDLENSAKFTLIKEVSELEELLSKKQQSRLLSSIIWEKNSIPYLILQKVCTDTLQIEVFSFHPYFASKTFEIPICKNIVVDQAAMHHVHDAIIQFIFKEPGISSSHILYVKTLPKRSPLQHNSISEIWEMDYDGKNPRRIISNNSLNLNPVYFPTPTKKEERRFLFVSYLLGQPKIFSSSTYGEEIQNLIPLRGNQILPNISHQSDKIAFICDATGRPDVFLQYIQPTGKSIGKPIQIFSMPHSVNASPVFSPDGNRLAFVSDKDWTPRIYLLDLKKENSIDNLTCITKKNRENTAPSWSPDGKKIAYSAKTNGIRQIWIYDLNTQEENQITIGPHHKENPFFAPNSIHIVYNTTGQESHIYVVDTNRKKSMQLTHGPGISHYPAWEPK
ncbi:MAG: hypothetical protein ACRCSV_05750 [Chlamydiales bacterium]